MRKSVGPTILWLSFILQARAVADDKNGHVENSWSKSTYLESHVVSSGLTGFKPNEGLVTEADWKETGSGLFFKEMKSTRFGAEEWNMTTAFDGKTYYMFSRDPKGIVMHVAKNVPNNVNNFTAGCFPFDPFDFLVKTSKDTNRTIPTLGDVLTFLAKGMNLALGQAVRATFQGSNALMIEFPGGEDSSGRPLNYKVYLEEASPHRLLGWDRFYSREFLHSELVVKEWKKIGLPNPDQTLEYPSKFSTTYYSNESKPPTVTFSYVETVDIKKIKIPTDSELSDFSLDPAEADIILDDDAKTTIRVPK